MSTEESDAYEFTRADECRRARDNDIVRQWMARKLIETLADLDTPITSDDPRVVRLDVARLATIQRDEIIRDWEINQAAERAE